VTLLATMSEKPPRHGHVFKSDGVCDRCGMSRREFDDGGEPYCAGIERPPIANPTDEPA
jgi:hypothetical protein